MPKLLKENQRILNAKAFIDSLTRVNPTPEYLFIFFGKNSPWTDENSPDTPNQSMTADLAIRNSLIGLKRVSGSNVAFVVPRYNWTTGTVYDEYAASDTSLFAKDFYVLTTDNNVYKCLDNNNGAQSTVQPTGTSTTPIGTGDGYSWKFMYNLSSSMISNFLTDDWLPVPYGGQKTSFQISVETNATYSSGTPYGGHGSNAYEELGAKYVMLSQKLDKDESGIFPVNDDYRQIGVILNPRLVGGSLATGSTYSVNDSNSTINELTGSILLIDNRKSASRSSDQAEVFQLIIGF
jgi:hypothetical protein